jgi:hypothetical protein
MPFITQGKTNWKYILIVVILVAVVGVGVQVYQYFWLPEQEIKSPEIKPPDDFLKCNSAKDCILGEKCVQICYNKDFQGWYNQNINFCKYRKVAAASCECENNQCKVVFQDKTADWKTDRNEEDGYEIKCPADWECVGGSLSGEIGDSEDWFYRLTRISISVLENPTKTLDEWSDEWIDSWTEETGFEVIKKEDIIINNKIAKKIWASGAPYEGGNSIEGRTIVVIYINDNKGVFFFSWIYNTDNLTEFNNIFTQIINTFQFLE